jgi:ATP-dependent DNA helicase RecG
MDTSSGVVKLQRISQAKLEQARELRKNMTEAELLLWEKLRRKSLYGIKFRRQQVIEGFIVDFYCERAKLVIEVDGGIHNTLEQKETDEHRKTVFYARGLKEVRFTNEQVIMSMNTVLDEIALALKK